MEQSIPSSVIGVDSVVCSPYPDFQLPTEDTYTLVTKHFPSYGSKICLVDGASGQQLSYAEFHSAITKFSSGLRRIGFGKGDLLCVVSPNTIKYPIVWLGTLATGGTVSMCNASFTVDSFTHQFMNSRPKIIATIAAILPNIQEASANAGTETIILMDGSPSAKNIVTYDSLVNDSGSLFSVPVSTQPDDIAVISYTSGTTNTGFPKGTLLTHRAICANVLQQNHPEAMSPKSGDHVIVVPPLHHSIVVTNLPTLYAGSTVVILPEFEPVLFLSAIEKYPNAILPLVPPFIVFFAKDPRVEKYNLTGIKDIITGAAPIGEDIIQAASRRTKCNIRQAYGLTEVGPNSHMMPRSLEMRKPNSVGPCLQNFKVKVVDPDNGEVLPSGKEGELWTKGPNVAKGYLNRPEATKEFITEDGWFKTGDLGYYDEEGMFYITDRLKEVIKVNGVKVAPARLEAVLLSHPKIADTAVIGVPDSTLGQAPKAFIVQKEEISKEEIDEFMREKVAEHQCLVGGITFIEAVPRTDTGKIKKQLLHAGIYHLKTV